MDISQRLQNMAMRLEKMAAIVQEILPVKNDVAELNHLKQTGSLAEFNVKFESVSAKLEWPEEYLVEAYVRALKEEIADSVLLFNPRTMQEARRMARVQEIAIDRKPAKNLVNRTSRHCTSSLMEQQSAPTSSKNVSLNDGSSLSDSGRVLQAFSNATEKKRCDETIVSEVSLGIPFPDSCKSAIVPFVSVQASASTSTKEIKNAEKSANEDGSASDFGTPYTWESVGTTFGEVLSTTNPVSSFVSSLVQSVSSISSNKLPVLTSNSPEMPLGYHGNYELATFGAISGSCFVFRDSGEWTHPKMTSGISGSSIFDFAEGLQGCSCHIDRCEDGKQILGDSAVQFVTWGDYFFPANSVSGTVEPAASTLSLYTGLQLSNIFSFRHKSFDSILDLGLGFVFEGNGPISLLQWANSTKAVYMLANLAFHVNFSPTRILLQMWFKGELIFMLVGRF